MRKIQFEEPPSLKNPKRYDSSFVDFISSCLEKDPRKRLSAKDLLSKHEKFFSFAKDQNYIVSTMLLNCPTVQERVNIYFFIFLYK